MRAYRYVSRGAHDMLLHDGSIMFTDSFRLALAATRPGVSGAIRFRGDHYRVTATETVGRKVMLRELAGC